MEETQMQKLLYLFLFLYRTYWISPISMGDLGLSPKIQEKHANLTEGPLSGPGTECMETSCSEAGGLTTPPHTKIQFGSKLLKSE